MDPLKKDFHGVFPTPEINLLRCLLSVFLVAGSSATIKLIYLESLRHSIPLLAKI